MTPMQVSTIDPRSLSATPTREQIDAFIASSLAAEALGVGSWLETTNYIAPGVYVREMVVRKGRALAGAVHKTDHIVIFDGDITNWHEGGMERITGRHVLLSHAGTQRVGYAHEDTRVTGIFPNPTNETDVRKLEAMFVENSEQLQCNRLTELPRREEHACLA